MEVENEIQLADISKIFIQDLNKTLHKFEHDQLVLILIDDGYEVETGISFINYFVVLVVEEIAHLGLACDDQLVDLTRRHGTSLRILCFYD